MVDTCLPTPCSDVPRGFERAATATAIPDIPAIGRFDPVDWIARFRDAGGRLEASETGVSLRLEPSDAFAPFFVDMADGAKREKIKMAGIAGRRGNEVDFWLGMQRDCAPAVHMSRPVGDDEALAKWSNKRSMHESASKILAKMGLSNDAGSA